MQHRDTTRRVFGSRLASLLQCDDFLLIASGEHTLILTELAIMFSISRSHGSQGLQELQESEFRRKPMLKIGLRIPLSGTSKQTGEGFAMGRCRMYNAQSTEANANTELDDWSEGNNFSEKHCTNPKPKSKCRN
jgi:hypothetical protein